MKLVLSALLITLLTGAMASDCCLVYAMDKEQYYDIEFHRGGRDARPENSLYSYQYALENGASTIECDMQLTSDGVLVMSHNPALNPDITTYADGRRVERDTFYIHDMTLEEVKAELANASLELGTVTEEYSDRTEKGKVISQGTSRNSSVEKGSKIDIVISKGKETYSAEVVIGSEYNMFDETRPEGLIDVVLKQEGMDDRVIYSESCNAESFPISIPCESSSDAPAQAYIKLDGEDIGGSLTVIFQ